MVTLVDILRSATESIRHATPESDGQSTVDVIEKYLDEQTGRSADKGLTNVTPGDAVAVDKLSAELLALCTQFVLSNKAQVVVSCKPRESRVHKQHYLILRFVHLLLPILNPVRIFQDWWETVLKPVLKTASYIDQIKKETRAIVSECLIIEIQQCREALPADTEPRYCKMIMEQYLEWAENYHKREERSLEQLDKPTERDETSRLRLQHQALLDLHQEEWSRNLTQILLNVGAEETKRFFTLLNTYFLSSKHRLQIVYLLSEFMLKKRTHLHEILDTALFQSMLNSLMFDNSTTLIAISVTNMIMLLPRICTSLPPFLPQLFYIFARAISWDQLRDMRKRQGTLADSTPASTTRIANGSWDCVDYTFSKLSAPPSNPQTGPFFTSLYGLYPCNFLQFLYKPYTYFERNNFKLPEEFDEETFKARTVTQVTRHMLHPNLVALDAETELTDLSRWMEMEPPDVIAQIMSLDLTNAASRVAFTVETGRSQSQPLEVLDESVLAHHSQAISQTDAPQHVQPSLPSALPEGQSLGVPSPSSSKANVIASILNVHRALKSGAEVLAGDDVWDAGLERYSTPTPISSHSPVSLMAAKASSDPATTSHVLTPYDGSMSPETKLLIAALKREVLLLRNELNFELFLKQQHLQHIGRLHREHVLDSSVEAERQQLYNTTRALMSQLRETTKSLEQLKAESALTKQKHVNWEDEQSSKLRNYREARKDWQNELKATQKNLEETERRLQEQNALLEDAQRQIFELESELRTIQPTLEKVSESEHRVKQLTQQMLLWEEDTAHLEEQKRYIKGLLSQWWSMEELVASLHSENQRLTEKQSELEGLKFQIREKEAKQCRPERPFGLEKTDKEDVRDKELNRLQSVVQEMRQRLEGLEMEKLEWQAQAEVISHAKTVGVSCDSSTQPDGISPPST